MTWERRRTRGLAAGLRLLLLAPWKGEVDWQKELPPVTRSRDSDGNEQQPGGGAVLSLVLGSVTLLPHFS